MKIDFSFLSMKNVSRQSQGVRASDTRLGAKKIITKLNEKHAHIDTQSVYLSVLWLRYEVVGLGEHHDTELDSVLSDTFKLFVIIHCLGYGEQQVSLAFPGSSHL